MKKPTEKQIQAEIKKLEVIAPKVCHYSAFGDDNRASVEAQIEVLKERMSEDKIYDRADEDKTAEEEFWPDNVRDAALEARAWMDGEVEEIPSKSWAGLVF